MTDYIDNTGLKEEVMKHDTIWSLICSPSRNYDHPIEEDITDIPVQCLEWWNDGSFVYVWGWPGPDYNRYDWSTFGTGWAFSREVLIDNWHKKEEHT